MGAYPSTAIQVQAAGSPLNGQFLKIGTGLDALTYVVPSQGDASLFGITNNTANYVGLWTQATNPPGGVPSVYQYIDTASTNQPVIWATTSRTSNQPAVGHLECGSFPPPGASGPLNRLGCETPASSPFQYTSGWAICDSRFGYGRNALWIYDPKSFNNAAPPGCTDVSLLILSAPSS